MARYHILLVNFSKKVRSKFQKMLETDYEFLTPDSLQAEKKIHLVLVHWQTKELCEDVSGLLQQKTTYKSPVYLFAPLKESLLLQCFQNGIDDFIDENWSDELIKAKLLAFFTCRKKFKKERSKKIKIGSVTINPKKRKVTKKGNEISLTKIEFDILSLLAQDVAKVFSRDEIYDYIWGKDIIVGDRTLDVHMNNLRKKIGKNKIRTKKGIGFGINSDLIN